MAWMVAFVLLLFYVLGAYAFHETSVIRSLPYIALLVLVSDFLLARLFKARQTARTDKST
ncbi:MAG TPA: hypothetical protein VKD91_05910 [Pyrinomonadaceae bacterium]|nr:hypothetical protein [Pyrinomonadaceae bacterium]